MRAMRSGMGSWAALVLGLGVYAASLLHLQGARYVNASPELLVSLPRFAQILFFAGDRHLAGNVGGFRALVAETARMKKEDYAVLAALQRDVAWMNPAHEDNYYTAANILPWGGQVAAAEEILRKAGAARPYDFLPYFHVGFIHYHFYRAPAEGAKWLLAAAEQTQDQQDKWSLQAVAAKWIERGYETSAAANLVDSMAANAPPGGMRTYLKMRAERLKMLVRLRSAALEFKSRLGREPERLEDLLREGLIAEVPKDPVGVGYVIGPDGMPGFASQGR